MLDDATNGVKQTVEILTAKIVKEKGSHPNVLKPKKFDPLMFGILHYAGQVFYTATGFLEKNSSVQPPEIVELMQSSNKHYTGRGAIMFPQSDEVAKAILSDADYALVLSARQDSKGEVDSCLNKLEAQD